MPRTSHRIGWLIALVLALQPAIHLTCELTCSASSVEVSETPHCHQPAAAADSDFAIRATPSHPCNQGLVAEPAEAVKRLRATADAAVPGEASRHTPIATPRSSMRPVSQRPPILLASPPSILRI